MYILIKENIKGIIFTDKDHPLDAYFKQEYKNFPKGGMYSGDPVTVHVQCSKKYFEEAIINEIGHHIDVKTGWSNSIVAQKEWKQAQIDDGDYIREYSKNAPWEDFADSVKEFVHHTSAFKKKFPNRFKLLEKIISSL